MIISRHLAVTGDTLEQMQAVLDTNFWLATHVVIVTIGYVASLLAGALGLIYLCLGMCTPILRDREVNRLFNAVIYGVVCFGMLTSFVGTVLGGIWADQSWGRFWGWDPKENGAVLVVIWNALILHARWGGMIKQRGVAVMSIFGAAVTVWSWFGTNQLGIGLHAYGFNATLATGCAVAWVFCTMFCLVGMLIPTRYWYSFAPQVPVIKK
jgi:ABC-type transport system involved in cytochrome c biogenesis permease subunit